MATLPDDSAAQQQQRWIIQCVLALGRRRPSDALMWSLMPYLAMTSIDLQATAVSGGLELRAAARNLVRAASSRRGPELVAIGPYLMVSTSVQNRRVLAPLAAELSSRGFTAHDLRWPRLGPGAMRRAHRRASALGDEARSELSSAGLQLHGGAGEEILQTAIFLEKCERLLDVRCPQVLLVASQHNSASRAVIAAALKVPVIRTAYVPHAPLADNVWYKDLPTHHALLRGAAESEFYGSIGVPETRLDVVGDPSLPYRAFNSPRTRATFVFATSPDDSANRLAPAIEVIRKSNIGPVEVAPHPRDDLARLRAACPPEWTFNPEPSTFRRLSSAGARAVIQFGSGVGLEVLSLGLPLIDLCNPGRQPNYPYLAPPIVPVVASSDQLAAAVSGLDSTPQGAERRMSYAASWVSAAGSEASRRAVDVLEDKRAQPLPDDIILDGWMRGSKPDAR